MAGHWMALFLHALLRFPIFQLTAKSLQKHQELASILFLAHLLAKFSNPVDIVRPKRPPRGLQDKYYVRNF